MSVAVDLFLAHPAIDANRPSSYHHHPPPIVAAAENLGLGGDLCSSSQSAQKQSDFEQRCQPDFVQVLTSLLSSPKVDPNAADREGNTCLIFLAMHGHLELIELLFRQQDERLQTVESSPAPHQRHEIKAILIEEETNQHAVDTSCIIASPSSCSIANQTNVTFRVQRK